MSCTFEYKRCFSYAFVTVYTRPREALSVSLDISLSVSRPTPTHGRRYTRHDSRHRTTGRAADTPQAQLATTVKPLRCIPHYLSCCWSHARSWVCCLYLRCALIRLEVPLPLSGSRGQLRRSPAHAPNEPARDAKQDERAPDGSDGGAYPRAGGIGIGLLAVRSRQQGA